jgi:hypothetical protein
MTPGELRSKRWNREVRGVRAEIKTPSLAERCRMLATRMPADAFFSHTTAALLLGLPLPRSLERSRDLDIARPYPARAPHARGLSGHQLDVAVSEMTTTEGIAHTSAARTWCDLAPLVSLTDLVAVGDQVIQRTLPLAGLDELKAAAERFVGRRGSRGIAEAIPLLDGRSESRPESILRVIIVRGGLLAPMVNHTLVDTLTGKTVRPDFLFAERKTILEYQGDYHRSRDQWRRDMTRRSRLETDGWKVMELNWDDLQNPVDLISRIRVLLARPT